MYTRITRSGGRSYLQLVESYRIDSGAVRQKVIANLGRLDQLASKDLDPLINGLNRALGRTTNEAFRPEYESAKAYGDVFVLQRLWHELGFGKVIQRALRSARRNFDAEAMVRAMVFNRLCAPDSKLGCLEWLQTVAVPDLPDTISHDHLLRAMDALMDHGTAVEDLIAAQMRPLLDQHLSVVFYDLTTIRIHGEGRLAGDVRAYGMNKDTGGIARQFVLGVVQSAEGLPLMHTVHPGNVAETQTLQSMLTQVLARFPVARVILIADRGLLSLDNLAELTELAAGKARQLQFILAVPARRYAELSDAFATLECTSERGRRASDRGAYSRFQRAVADAGLTRFIQADYHADRFSYGINEAAVTQAERFDGKLILLTNVTDFSASEVVQRYKSLADIERGFRVLKSDLEIAPVYHRLPERIRAHALICFLALVLYRVMRLRLKANGSAASPKTALQQLGRIQQHRATVGSKTYSGISRTTPEQLELFAALHVPIPK